MGLTVLARSLILTILVTASLLHAEENRKVNKSNLEIMQSLIGELTGQILDHANVTGPFPVFVSCKGSDECWVTEQAMQSLLTERRYTAYADSARTLAELVRIEVLPVLHVEYDHEMEGGLLGAKNVERNVTVSLTYRLLRVSSGEVLAGSTASKQQRDTVAIDDVGGLENPAIRVTQARLPEGSFFDRIMEPLVIVGAVGTMVFLLFHVRS